MPTHRKLAPASPWTEVTATKKDWHGADPRLLTSMFTQTLLIRTFEEYVLDLAGQGLVHGRRTPASARRAAPSAPCCR